MTGVKSYVLKMGGFFNFTLWYLGSENGDDETNLSVQTGS